MPLDQLNIRNEEIEEILGKTPNSIIRWGVTVLLLIVIILLVGSWFFKYPDTIRSTVELTTMSPPSDVVAKATGKFDTIFISNNEVVKTSQVLAIIENPSEYDDVVLLSDLLNIYDHNEMFRDSVLISRNGLLDNLELGELQSHYSLFVSAFSNYYNYYQLGYYAKKIKAIEKQIMDYQAYYRSTENQKQTLQIDLDLAQKDYDRHQNLYKSQTIADVELENSQSRYLNKKSSFESISTSLANVNIQISQLENSLLDLELQHQQQKENLIISLNSAYDNLRAQLDIWKQRYLLVAPMNGICIFTKYWSRNQNVTLGEKIMTIIPENSDDIIGKLLLPVRGAGKVKVGQRVNIRLLNYPYMEFGVLEGLVKNISGVPNEDFYYVEVSLPNGMKTNYNIDITFSQNMQGSAEIITDDIRILSRVFQPIKSIIKNRL